jgi:two-component system nitrogen regulation response regulator GlnG
VGSNETVKSNFRLVSATHQDLPHAVREGTFRHDLYYRLCAFQIEMPPLRERRDDIRLLAEHFVGLILNGQSTHPALSEPAARELVNRPWHGNVRELRNVLEHAVTVARHGVIDVEHLPPAIPLSLTKGTRADGDLSVQIAALIDRWARERLTQPQECEQLYEQLLGIVEPPLLQAALDKHRGQCANAARNLGLHRTTVRKKLDEFGISSE